MLASVFTSQRKEKNIYMFSVFLSSYRNKRESLGELEKAVGTLAARVATSFLVIPNFHSFLKKMHSKNNLCSKGDVLTD